MRSPLFSPLSSLISSILSSVLSSTDVWFIQTHPESLTKVISTVSILISHVQTLSIIMNLRLSWPPSAEAVTSAMVVNVLELETLRPECLVGEDGENVAFALLFHWVRPARSKVAVFVAPRLASTGSSGCI